MESCGETDIQALTEGCIANILSMSMITPLDACRLSVLSPTFCSAAQSDTVWERFFPSDYREIISSSIDGQVSLLDRFRCKKDLYMYLSDNPFLIDEGRKSFWLDKRSGKKCYMLAARDLNIELGDSPLHWQWISFPESRFPEAAELLNIDHLEIWGQIKTSILSPGTKYAAYFVYTTKSTFEGFDNNPVVVSLCNISQERKPRGVSLVPLGGENLPAKPENHPKQRGDGWFEVVCGEFMVTGREENVDLEMWLYKGKKWKRGIIVQGFEIRPKE